MTCATQRAARPAKYSSGISKLVELQPFGGTATRATLDTSFHSAFANTGIMAGCQLTRTGNHSQISGNSKYNRPSQWWQAAVNLARIPSMIHWALRKEDALTLAGAKPASSSRIRPKSRMQEGDHLCCVVPRRPVARVRGH